MPDVYNLPSSLNVQCWHKTQHAHGTYVCFAIDLCRCDECVDAHRRYNQHRKSWASKNGTSRKPYVNSNPARNHVNRLVAQGMSVKRVAKKAGLSGGLMSRLMYGDYVRGTPPSRRIRWQTSAKIRAVVLDLADGARVDRTEADLIIEELLARGWSKRQIALRITGPRAGALQVGRYGTGEVMARTIRLLRPLQFQEVPLRLHGPTGRLIQPKRDHEPRLIEATTIGVPIALDLMDKYERWDLDKIELEEATIAADHQLRLDRLGLRSALQSAKERDQRDHRRRPLFEITG